MKYNHDDHDDDVDEDEDNDDDEDDLPVQGLTLLIVGQEEPRSLMWRTITARIPGFR